MQERVWLRGDDLESKKNKGAHVVREVWDEQKLEGRYIKYRSSNHKAQDCKAPSRAKTPLLSANANQKPLQKKRKFHKAHIKIMEFGLQEDSVNK